MRLRLVENSSLSLEVYSMYYILAVKTVTGLAISSAAITPVAGSKNVSLPVPLGRQIFQKHQSSDAPVSQPHQWRSEPNSLKDAGSNCIYNITKIRLPLHECFRGRQDNTAKNLIWTTSSNIGMTQKKSLLLPLCMTTATRYLCK